MVFEHLNSQKNYQPGYFRQSIEPMLTRVASRKPVVWFSGDVGVSWSLPTFYWRVPGQKLTYVATGLGDTANDAIIKVNVSSDGQVAINAVSLTGAEVLPIERYGPEYWSARTAALPPATYGQRAMNCLTDKKFYAGVLAGLIIIGAGLGVRRLVRRADWRGTRHASVVGSDENQDTKRMHNNEE